jgi:hypothetical protein
LVIGAGVVIGAVVIGVALWRTIKGQRTIAPIGTAADGKDGPVVGDDVNCSVVTPPGLAPTIGETVAPARHGKTKRKMDDVECSVFASAKAEQGCTVIIQALLHRAQQLAQAVKMATERDASANRKAVTKLSTRIARGTLVQLFLEIPALSIANPFQEVTWQGEPVRTEYAVEIPYSARVGACRGTLHIMLDGLSVGEIIFEINISGKEQEDTIPLPGSGMPLGLVDRGALNKALDRLIEVGVNAKHFTCAFLSYSRKDAEIVLLGAELLDGCGIELLVDVNSIEPGEEWAEKIPHLIGRADIFFLMWSENAAGSDWVDRETRIAIRRYDKNPNHEPRIHPVMIEQPAPKLPRRLKRFQNKSIWLALRMAQKHSVFQEGRGDQ